MLAYVLLLIGIILSKEHNSLAQDSDSVDVNDKVDQLIDMVLRDYGQQIDPVLLYNFGPYKLGMIGTVSVRSGSIHGLRSAKRLGNAYMSLSDQNPDSISVIGKLEFRDIKANLKVDVKFYDSLSLRGTEIEIKLTRAVLDLELVVDFGRKDVTIKKISLDSVEGFAAKATKASFPVRKIVNSQLKRQSKRLQRMAKDGISELNGYRISDIDNFDNIVAKLA